MDYSIEAPKAIAVKIMAGELPSVVLRSVIDQHGDLKRGDLGPLLVSAWRDSGLSYDQLDLMQCVWSWQIFPKSDAQDTQFNVRVIDSLLDSGVSLPWDLEYCESERQRIQPALAAEAAAEKQAELSAVSFENLAAKINEQEGTPVCIQALWDGDSRGWHIWLSVIMKNNDLLIEESLGPVRFGGDFRLFKGAVPPWPEAEYATDVGRRLADHFGSEFYFPSPNKPEIDLARWVQSPGQLTKLRGKKPWWRLW